MSNRAAIRYAKALLQNANENNTEAVIFGDMQSVYNSIEGSKELQMLLQSPLVKANDKKEALLKIFSGKSEALHALINVLSNNKRFALLSGVAENYMSQYNEQQGVKLATVITAVPLSDALEAKVMDKIKELTGSEKVRLTNQIDPAIIGGFILRVGDIQYNASIANQFSNLKREFSKSI